MDKASVSGAEDWGFESLQGCFFGSIPQDSVTGWSLGVNDGIVRSYHGESTRSHPNSEVKHHWACSVLRWGTTRESQVVYVFTFLRYTTMTLAFMQGVTYIGDLWGFESFDVTFPPIV